MGKPFPAYEGDEPYVFVSYSHEDETVVFNEIRWLQDQRVNVWYDAGINPGSEWSEALAKAIEGCTYFIYFITRRSVASENCRRELNFAQEEHQRVLAVYLEATDVPSGMRLSLDNRQAIFRYKQSNETYQHALIQSIRIEVAGQSFPLKAQPKSRALILFTFSAFVVMAVGLFLYRQFEINALNDTPATTSAEGITESTATLSATFEEQETSVVVLPFKVHDNSPANIAFADGLTQTLITRLSKISRLVVVPSKSPFLTTASSSRFFADSTTTAEAARQLGVRYVVESTVQRSSDQLRFYASLVDTQTGAYLWVEDYDRSLMDVFDVQDDIARNIVTALQVTLDEDERHRFNAAPTTDLEAYDLYNLAMTHFWKASAADYDLASELLERAVALDPEYATAYAMLGISLIARFNFKPEPGYVERGRSMLARSLQLDDGLAIAHSGVGYVHYVSNDLKSAVAEYEKALAAEPNNAETMALLGNGYVHAGKTSQGVALLEKSLRIPARGAPHTWGPDERIDPLVFSFLGKGYYFLGDLEAAVRTLKLAISRAPEMHWPYVHIAAAYVALGQDEDAVQAVKRIGALKPSYSLGCLRRTQHYVDQSAADLYFHRIAQAGLANTPCD